LKWIEIEIEFMEAVKGTTKTVNYDRIEICNYCKGSGNKKGGHTKCSACRGTGMHKVQKGPILFQSTCNKCGGTGNIMKDPCE